MPSPTSSTRPTSRVSMEGRKSAISRSRTEAISAVFKAMSAPLVELVPYHLDPGADAGVVDVVADAHQQTAQDVGVDPEVQDGFPAEGPAQVVGQPAALLVRQQDGRA